MHISKVVSCSLCALVCSAAMAGEPSLVKSFELMLSFIDSNSAHNTQIARAVGNKHIECLRNEDANGRFSVHVSGDELPVDTLSSHCDAPQDAVRKIMACLPDAASTVTTGPITNRPHSFVRVLSFDGRKVLHIRIAYFSTKEKEHLLNRVKHTLRDYESYYGIILDLRGNPGGAMVQGYEVAAEFVKEGSLGASIDKHGLYNWYQGQKGHPVLQQAPTVLLVDRATASSAEIFLYGLVDNGRVKKSLGECTYGKGSHQMLQKFAGIGWIKVTHGYLVRKNRERWHGTCYEPDIKLDLSELSEEEVLWSAWKQLRPYARKPYYIPSKVRRASIQWAR